MKKLILSLIWVVISAGFIYLVNCSKPLDVSKIIQETDTVFVSDTIIFSDTLYADTTFIDTLYIDSTIIDTVIVDTMFCARLNSQRQEIVWMLFNQEGQFHLELQTLTERIRGSQTLLIDINGAQFQWEPADNRELEIDINLERNTIIRITTTPPHAYGQAIDICLRIRAP